MVTTVNSPRRAGSCAQRDITSHVAGRQGFCQEQVPGDKSDSIFLTLIKEDLHQRLLFWAEGAVWIPWDCPLSPGPWLLPPKALASFRRVSSYRTPPTHTHLLTPHPSAVRPDSLHS